jgi:hypothetical protein
LGLAGIMTVHPQPSKLTWIHFCAAAADGIDNASKAANIKVRIIDVLLAALDTLSLAAPPIGRRSVARANENAMKIG